MSEVFFQGIIVYLQSRPFIHPFKKFSEIAASCSDNLMLHPSGVAKNSYPLKLYFI